MAERVRAGSCRNTDRHGSGASLVTTDPIVEGGTAHGTMSGVQTLIVRTATAAELADAGAVVVEAYVADGLGGNDEYLAEVADAGSRAVDGEVLVAVDGDGRVLGSVTYARHGSTLAEVCGTGEAEFRMLGVSPRARGRGAGEALVLACIDRARQHGVTRLVLSTQAQSRAAHRIYERLGFRRRPELDWTPVPDVDLMGYALDLGAPVRPPDPGGAARP
jgi:GNAT superfamily N-acetyltransferase